MFGKCVLEAQCPAGHYIKAEADTGLLWPELLASWRAWHCDCKPVGLAGSVGSVGLAGGGGSGGSIVAHVGRGSGLDD